MKERNRFLALIIFLLCLSGFLHQPVLADPCDLDESWVKLDSAYRILLEIERFGGDVTTLQKELSELLSIISEIQYLDSINDRDGAISLEDELCQKTIQLDEASKELFQTSLSLYEDNHMHLIYKTLILNGITIISLIVVWNLVLRLYYQIIREYEVVKSP